MTADDLFAAHGVAQSHGDRIRVLSALLKLRDAGDLDVDQGEDLELLLDDLSDHAREGRIAGLDVDDLAGDDPVAFVEEVDEEDGDEDLDLSDQEVAALGALLGGDVGEEPRTAPNATAGHGDEVLDLGADPDEGDGEVLDLDSLSLADVLRRRK